MLSQAACRTAAGATSSDTVDDSQACNELSTTICAGSRVATALSRMLLFDLLLLL